jgi:hypothetical protein
MQTYKTTHPLKSFTPSPAPITTKTPGVPSTHCLGILKKLLAVLMTMKMCPFNIFIWDLEMKFVLFKGTQR